MDTSFTCTSGVQSDLEKILKNELKPFYVQSWYETNFRPFLKTTSDWKAFFYKFYELKIYL